MSIKKYASEDWVKEQLANVEGGVTSWNDLEDRPFGETEDGEIKTIDPKYLPEIDMSDYETKEDAQAKLEAAAGYTHSNIYYKKIMIDSKDKAINKKISNISKTITEQNIDTAFNDIFGGE